MNNVKLATLTLPLRILRSNFVHKQNIITQMSNTSLTISFIFGIFLQKLWPLSEQYLHFNCSQQGLNISMCPLLQVQREQMPD